MRFTQLRLFSQLIYPAMNLTTFTLQMDGENAVYPAMKSEAMEPFHPAMSIYPAMTFQPKYSPGDESLPGHGGSFLPELFHPAMRF